MTLRRTAFERLNEASSLSDREHVSVRVADLRIVLSMFKPVAKLVPALNAFLDETIQAHMRATP